MIITGLCLNCCYAIICYLSVNYCGRLTSACPPSSPTWALSPCLPPRTVCRRWGGPGGRSPAYPAPAHSPASLPHTRHLNHCQLLGLQASVHLADTVELIHQKVLIIMWLTGCDALENQTECILLNYWVMSMAQLLLDLYSTSMFG